MHKAVSNVEAVTGDLHARIAALQTDVATLKRKKTMLTERKRALAEWYAEEIQNDNAQHQKRSTFEQSVLDRLRQRIEVFKEAWQRERHNNR
ncbi:unnamed protein product [Phytomonas sp. Hart1]|nr:unnamed protein product [Phytomonas sp. Hart1]|eukprot:CCW67552.1 unnamed protein product [Phytomonas sp. isolate Hart1]